MDNGGKLVYCQFDVADQLTTRAIQTSLQPKQASHNFFSMFILFHLMSAKMAMVIENFCHTGRNPAGSLAFLCARTKILKRAICGSHSRVHFDGTRQKFSMSRLISLNDDTDCQLCTSIAPPFLWQPASVAADVISVCVKLLVAAGKWQDSGSSCV
jgi:hypothetical protein